MWCIYTEVVFSPRKKMNRTVCWKIEIPRNYHTRQSKSGAERKYCISPLSFVGSRAFVTTENIYSNVCVCVTNMSLKTEETLREGRRQDGRESGGQRPKGGRGRKGEAVRSLRYAEKRLSLAP